MNEWKKTFACSFAAQVLSILGFSFSLPFLPFFIEELGITDPARQAWWAGVILAATGITLALFAPIWGLLADRYGRKKMVMRSMLSGALVLFLISTSRNIGELLVYRLLQGALTGTVSASIALVASVTPTKRSGFAMGMMQSAVFVGIALGPLLGGMLADQYGYRTAFRYGAVIVALGGILIQFGTRESRAAPEEHGGGNTTMRDILRNRGFIAAIIMLLAVRFANTIVNPAFPLIIKDILTDIQRLNSVTGMVMAFSGTAGAVSAGILGYVGDRVGHRRVVMICVLIAACSSAAHALARTISMLTVVHMLFGLALAGILPAINAIIQGNIDRRHMGKAFGIASSISMLGLALGPLTGGFLGSQYGIRAPFLAAGMCQLVVALIISRRGNTPVARN